MKAVTCAAIAMLIAAGCSGEPTMELGDDAERPTPTSGPDVCLQRDGRTVTRRPPEEVQRFLVGRWRACDGRPATWPRALDFIEDGRVFDVYGTDDGRTYRERNRNERHYEVRVGSGGTYELTFDATRDGEPLVVHAGPDVFYWGRTSVFYAPVRYVREPEP